MAIVHTEMHSADSDLFSSKFNGYQSKNLNPLFIIYQLENEIQVMTKQGEIYARLCQ